MTATDQAGRAAEAAAMTKDELRKAVRRLGGRPAGGLSRATRSELVNWYVMNSPRRPTAHNGDVLCAACGGVGAASCICTP
jgi:hypothetical protein